MNNILMKPAGENTMQGRCLLFSFRLNTNKGKKMIRFVISIILVCEIFSCSPKMPQQSFIFDQCYKSQKGHLFAGKEICFYNDGTFKYFGNGPSTFLSLGNWKYDPLINEVELISIVSNETVKYRNRVDTMYVDLTGKKVKVMKSNQIAFDEKIYKIE